MRRTIPKALALLVSSSVLGVGVTAAPAAGSDIDAAAHLRVTADYGKLPMSFEANQGQADSRVRFLARGSGYGLFLTPTEAVLSLHGVAASSAQSNAVIRMRLAGANPQPQVIGLDLLPGTSNYFIGNDPAKWHSAVPNYAKVKYAQVYPGIDVVYYGRQQQLEYDFIVAPGGDPKRIVLDFKGVKRVALDRDGDLVLVTAAGEVVQHKPLVYQLVDGARQAIDGHYVLHGKRRASFQIARYDTARPLVIDPTLVFATYLGGSDNDFSTGIAVDSNGNAYVTGYTRGGTPGFPTTPGAYQTTFGGGTGSDVFVTKLNATGDALVYSTYMGGSGNDYGSGIAVDGSGNAYVTGYTDGSFPTTPGAYRTAYGGGSEDGFVAKLNATGSALVYSTYLGGSGEDVAYGIAVDGSGNVYVTGFTSGSFPTSPGAYQTTFGGGFDAFVTKLNATGSALVYSTYLGGDGHDLAYGIAVDGAGNAYVTGDTTGGFSGFPTTPGAYQAIFGGGFTDAFVTKLNTTGSALVYSTYLGGIVDEYAYGIAVDGSGNAYVTGQTGGGFPVTPGAYQTAYGGSVSDAFVTKLNTTGNSLVYSTYLGSGGADAGFGIAVDATRNTYVTGWTSGGGFPTTPDAYQTAFGGGNADAFVTKLNAAGSALVYSTSLGGSGGEYGTGIAVDSSGNIYVMGYTSGSFPTTPGAYQTAFGGGGSDIFVARLGEVIPGVRVIVPDGTSLKQTFASYPETRWFAMTVEPGKTYVVEAADVDGDLTLNGIGTVGVFEVGGVWAPPEASVDCTAPNGPRPPAVDVMSDGIRCVIRTFPPNGTLLNKRPVYVKVTRMNPATGGASQFKIRAREATIYGRWLTSGYDYHVEVENTTGDPMCVEVTRYPASGLTYALGPGWSGAVSSFTLTVPAFGAVKQVIPNGGLVGADGEGALRVSACNSPTNLIPGALHVSTYAFDTVGNRYIYLFTSTANEGKTRSTW